MYSFQTSGAIEVEGLVVRYAVSSYLTRMHNLLTTHSLNYLLCSTTWIFPSNLEKRLAFWGGSLLVIFATSLTLTRLG